MKFKTKMILSLIILLIIDLIAEYKLKLSFMNIPQYIIMILLILGIVLVMIICIVEYWHKSRKILVNYMYVAIVLVFICSFFTFNIPFKKHTESIVINNKDCSIIISRFYRMTNQKLRIQIPINSFITKEINCETFPVSSKTLEEAIYIKWLPNNSVEIVYNPTESQIYSWIYNFNNDTFEALG